VARPGIQVHEAGGGAEALELLRSGPVDLVLLDLQMPQMDGQETAERIRDQLSLEKLPLIAVTANAFAATEIDLEAHGFNDLLIKPANQESLNAILARWLKARPAKAASPEPSLDTLSPEMRRLLIEDLKTGRESLMSGDAPTMERASHRLNGTASLLGLTVLRQRAQELEDRLAGRGRRHAEDELPLDPLLEEIDRLLAVVEQDRGEEDGRDGGLAE